MEANSDIILCNVGDTNFYSGARLTSGQGRLHFSAFESEIYDVPDDVRQAAKTKVASALEDACSNESSGPGQIVAEASHRYTCRVREAPLDVDTLANILKSASPIGE